MKIGKERENILEGLMKKYNKKRKVNQEIT